MKKVLIPKLLPRATLDENMRGLVSKQFSRTLFEENARGPALSERSESNGFALIYVFLFITLIGVTVFAAWAGSMSEMRLSRRNESSIEAYQLAKTAIETGWAEYQAAVGETNELDENIPSKDACKENNPQVTRYYLKDGQKKDVNLKDILTLEDAKAGVYDFRVCGDELIIEGIGYYKGNKITLKAEITHDDSLDIPDDLNTPENEYKINLSQDTLKIYQTGPSK